MQLPPTQPVDYRHPENRYQHGQNEQKSAHPQVPGSKQTKCGRQYHFIGLNGRNLPGEQPYNRSQPVAILLPIPGCAIFRFRLYRLFQVRGLVLPLIPYHLFYCGGKVGRQLFRQTGHRLSIRNQFTLLEHPLEDSLGSTNGEDAEQNLTEEGVAEVIPEIDECRYSLRSAHVSSELGSGVDQHSVLEQDVLST